MDDIDVEKEDIGELEIAEYVVFLLALNTYQRYVWDAAGEKTEDDLMRRANSLIKMADRRHAASYRAFLHDNLPNPAHKRTIDKAFSMLPNTGGLGRRAVGIRTALNKSGAPAMRAVFKSNQALREIKAAMAASVMQDLDEALDKYAVIAMRNPRFRKWIDDAAASAGAGAPQNAVTIAAGEVASSIQSMMEVKAQQQAAAPSSEGAVMAAAAHEEHVKAVEVKATEAAERALAVSGEPDEPPKKSQVVGIATAAVAAAMSDPSLSSTAPEPLKHLDEEQRAAALTDGRVLVAAGAGAGKCVVGDTLVRTSDGLIEIACLAAEIQPGSSAPFVATVLGVDGPEKTSTILNEGLKPTVRVVTSSGYTVEGTGNHPVIVLRDGELLWKLLSELRTSDFVCIDRRPGLFAEKPYEVTRRPFKQVTNARPSRIPTILTPQVASLLGWIVSEGCVHYSAHANIQLTTADTVQLEMYKQAADGLVDYGVASRVTEDGRTIHCLRFGCKSNLEALADFGLGFAPAEAKEIPTGILRSPKPIVVAFLRALFSGDGGFHRNTVYYDSASMKLIRQLQVLLLSFGIVSQVRYKPNACKGSWNLVLNGDDARLFLTEIGFQLSSKQEAADAYFANRAANPNLDVVPSQALRIRSVMREARAFQSISEHPKYHSFKCYAMGTREPSYRMLGEFLEAFPVVHHEPHVELEQLWRRRWYFDRVESLTESVAQVYDFIVPETHTFSAGGFVNHNSTTLVSRIDYLVKERKVNPARVLACSFNKKAADELKVKLGKKIGSGNIGPTGVQVGTMHSLFYKFIVGDKQTQGFGTEEERAMLLPPRLIAPSKKGSKNVSPSSLSIAIRNIWQKCDAEAMAGRYGYPVDWVAEPPKAKKVNTLINKWRGNGIGLEEARASVKSQAEAKAVIWYEMYLGLKGDLPGWRPACMPDSYNNFMRRNRPGGERLGDLEDMIKVFLDILRRDPKARATVQGMFDHILVDEAQDLNSQQHEIFEILSQGVTEANGQSIWMIGDEKQSIYSFRGARPELFTSFHGKDGWKTRIIKTNYRCEPEIISAANKLIAHNEQGVPMEARANPTKAPGKASIVVETPEDNTAAAIATIGRVVKDMEEGAVAEDYAVLARTNAELNDFETACIINEIPYVRQGGRGFLEAPESRAVLGYLDLVNGSDYERMKDSLVAVLTKPDRGLYLSPDDVGKAVDEALDLVARRERIDAKSINPRELLDQSQYRRILADQLKAPYRLKIMSSAKGDRKKGEWMYNKRVEELEDNLSGLAAGLGELSEHVQSEAQDTPGLLNFILDNMKSEVQGWDPGTRRSTLTVTSLREQITNDTAVFSDDDDDADEEDDEDKQAPAIGEEGELGGASPEKTDAKGLGAVQFLFAMATPNPNDHVHNTDPSTAKGFADKVARYSKLSESLRIDLDKWEKEQAKTGLPYKKPPAITLTTVHRCKGLEWPNVSVLMPKGKFPIERKPKPDEPPPDPVEEAERMKAERNLAYVALTRAAVNLEVICPESNGMSRFVLEAGLAPGENVPKPNAAAESVAKTASHFMDPYVQETLERFASDLPRPRRRHS